MSLLSSCVFMHQTTQCRWFFWRKGNLHTVVISHNFFSLRDKPGLGLVQYFGHFLCIKCTLMMHNRYQVFLSMQLCSITLQWNNMSAKFWSSWHRGCFFQQLAPAQNMENIKAPNHSFFCEGNPNATVGFIPKCFSNTEIVSISWRSRYVIYRLLSARPQ